MRKNSQTSVVWDYFEKIEIGGRCTLCQNTVSCTGNTSNLVKHLRRRHQEVLHEGVVQPRKRTPEDSSDYEETEGDAIVVSEEEPNEVVTETNTAVHTIQAYRDLHGTTFLYLQPAVEGEPGVQIQNAQFQPIVATSESITANGEIVSVAVQKDPSGPEAIEEAKTAEEATSRKVVHAPVKNYQGSAIATRTVVRQLARPSPIKTTPPAASSNGNDNNNNNNNNNNKEDSYEAFGKYIASMLRNLPSKNAWKLQGEIVNWILKEQIKNTSC